MCGTPTLLLIDRQGVLCHSLFGHVLDLQVGLLVGQLLAEPALERCEVPAAEFLHQAEHNQAPDEAPGPPHLVIHNAIASPFPEASCWN